jgi:hypothetical protein
VKDKGWVEAAKLLPGDEVFTSAGGWVRVSNGTWLSQRQTVYNVEVEGFHTYFVGETGLWVHNVRCGQKLPKKRGPKPGLKGPHNKKIHQVAQDVQKKGNQVIAGGKLPGATEAVIPTPGGKKLSRRPDILARRPDGSLYGINVGKQMKRGPKRGLPCDREIDAIYDLEIYADLEMHFVPYN